MGSNITTVGGKAGVPLHTFTAAAQDSGPLFITKSSDPTNLFNLGEASSILGFKTAVFQLTGAGTGLDITVYGTIDRDTAYGSGSEWVEIPAPSTEAAYQWSNPLRNATGQKVLACDKPFLAFRAVSSATPGGNISGSTVLQGFVTG